MIKLLSAVLVAGTLAAGGAAFAAEPSSTLGEKLGTGDLSYGAFLQLISGSGYSEQEARTMTLQDIAGTKSQWQDNN